MNKIACINLGGKTINLYAFATRYCNWHNMEAYPIYDKIMEDILGLYLKKIKSQNLLEEEVFHYSTYKEKMEEFRNSLDLKNFNFKEIDKFIWIHGKKILQELAALQ